MILSQKQLDSLLAVTEWQLNCRASQHDRDIHPARGRESPSATELEQAIMRQVMQRTGGRIQMLNVEVVGQAVVIRGRAPTYYLKQLALQGVLDRLGPAAEMRIELNIEVADGSAMPQAAPHS
jgi:hypothetical protein